MISPAEKILSQIQLHPDMEGLVPMYNPHIGFAYTHARGEEGGGSMTLIGFSGQRQAPVVVSEEHGDIRSVTELADLQPEERSIKMQARGVGTRVYNTIEALVGTGEGDIVNAYTFEVNTAKIVDRRRSSDGTIRGRIAQASRQAARIAQTKVMGLEATVNGIHASFGDPENVDAVLYGQSATMELQQRKLGGVEQPAGIPPEFLVIRNPHIVMYKIGECPVG